MIVLTVVFLAVIYIFGPKGIAYYLKAQTDALEINHYKTIYREKSEKGVTDSVSEYALLWARVRRIELDEGHEDRTFSEDWAVVFDYWKCGR